ncbi:hypothetical protein Syun_007394 [Stephania yunnanensis]|uniref:Uncharacterized protein n=1 Tax=Stephania yunnanensis TaxID=152371 RepID=A0AAP0KYE9_9MAGN
MTFSSSDQDHLKATGSSDEEELLTPLVVANDSNKSSFQGMHSVGISIKKWICKASLISFLTLAVAAVIVVLYIVCVLIRPN